MRAIGAAEMALEAMCRRGEITDAQSLAAYLLLRLHDDGRVPRDNPFAAQPGYLPHIFSLGHRNQLGMALNPWTKEIWSGEQGPNGGVVLRRQRCQ